MRPAPTLRQAILAFNPTFLFVLNEQSGTVASSVGGHSGSVNGAPTFDVSELGVGDGGGIGYGEAGTAYHSAPDHADLDLGGSFTVGCLFRYTVDAADTQIFFSKGTNAYGIGITTGKNLAFVKIGVAIMVRGSSSLSIGTTVGMALATYSGANTAILYQDGLDVSTARDASNTFADTASALEIGRFGTEGAGADISHVFGVKSVLTAADALHLWRAARGELARTDYTTFPVRKLRRAA